MPSTFTEQTTLGRTGLKVGRLGISSSYGAPAAAFEEAFERGCNYFTWGTFLRGRSAEMKKAVRNIVKKGRRDDLVLSLVTYAHNAFLTEIFLKKGLAAAGVDHADVLILGYYPGKPPRRVMDGALRLKQSGLIRFIGLTSHNRDLFPRLDRDGLIDVFHIRYNAVHRGAETDAFPHIGAEKRPGIVSFTATCWQRLLKPNKMPPDENPPRAGDCYRFALSHPAVDVCMSGARNLEQMRENLQALAAGPMTGMELERMRKIGDAIHRK